MLEDTVPEFIIVTFSFFTDVATFLMCMNHQLVSLGCGNYVTVEEELRGTFKIIGLSTVHLYY